MFLLEEKEKERLAKYSLFLRSLKESLNMTKQELFEDQEIFYLFKENLKSRSSNQWFCLRMLLVGESSGSDSDQELQGDKELLQLFEEYIQRKEVVLLALNLLFSLKNITQLKSITYSPQNTIIQQILNTTQRLIELLCINQQNNVKYGNEQIIKSLIFLVLVEISISKLRLKITTKSMNIFQLPKLTKQLKLFGLIYVTQEEATPISQNKDYMATREEWIKKERNWAYQDIGANFGLIQRIKSCEQFMKSEMTSKSVKLKAINAKDSIYLRFNKEKGQFEQFEEK